MTIFKKSALVLAMTATAGMANAAGFIDISATAGPDASGADQTSANFLAGTAADGTGPVFLDSLLVGSTAYTVDPTVGNTGVAAANVTVARVVSYTPNTTISAGSTVTFTIENGAIADGDRVQLSDNETGVLPVKAGITDFDATADGYTRVRFIVEPGETLQAGTPYFMITADLGAGNQTTPDFVVDGGSSVGTKLTVAATSAQDSSGLDIAQGTAPAEALVEVVNGTNVTVRDVTSTIDVEAAISRALFVVDDGATVGAAPGQAEAETTTILSRASLDIVLGGEVGPDLSGDNFELTLARGNTDGVVSATLDVNADGTTTGNVVDTTATSGAYVLAGVNASILQGTHNIDITVNGTDVLSLGEWLTSLTVDDTGGVGTVTAMDEVKTHTWDINGAQFKIPYHAQNVSGFNFFFNAVNETSNDAAIAADVIVENKSQNTRESVSAVDLGTALAEGSTTVGQAAIKSAIIAAGGTMNNDDVYHVHMELTVNAPQNDIQVAAFQKDAVGRTVVPVYINSNNNNDGRKWQQ